MRLVLLFTWFFLIKIGFSQGSYTPLNTQSYHQIDRLDIKYGKILPLPHTSVKPFNRKMIGEFAESMYNSNIDFSSQEAYNINYLLNDNTEWIDSFEYSRKPFLKVFYPEKASMLGVENESFILKVNPVLHVDLGKEFDNQFLFTNTRGFELRAYVKKKLGFYTYIGENQLRMPSYIREERIGRFYKNVPGDGYYKDFRGNAQDFFAARGYMTFNVIDHLDFQFGYDKNFIGNGYRSMFLSDNSNAYLFLKMNLKVWRLNYQTLFTELVGQYERGGDRLLDKKFAVFHHLNYSVTNWLDIGIFESVVFSRSQNFELHYLNPLIFYRSIEQDLGSPDNVTLGFDYKANFLNSFSYYGQIVISEFNFANVIARNGWWANKFGFQQGLKYIDVAGIDNLDLQLEYNSARPFLYTHKERSGSALANYTHYNQELAHPLGANFREFITIVRYQPKPIPQLNFQVEFMHALSGRDTAGLHYGSNIFLPTGANFVVNEFENKIGQGNAHKITYLNFMASYEFWHNMYADFSIGVRNLSTSIEGEEKGSTWIGAGIRLNTSTRRRMY